MAEYLVIRVTEDIIRTRVSEADARSVDVGRIRICKYAIQGRGQLTVRHGLAMYESIVQAVDDSVVIDVDFAVDDRDDLGAARAQGAFDDAVIVPVDHPVTIHVDHVGQYVDLATAVAAVLTGAAGDAAQILQIAWEWVPGPFSESCSKKARVFSATGDGPIRSGATLCGGDRHEPDRGLVPARVCRGQQLFACIQALDRTGAERTETEQGARGRCIECEAYGERPSRVLISRTSSRISRWLSNTVS